MMAWSLTQSVLYRTCSNTISVSNPGTGEKGDEQRWTYLDELRESLHDSGLAVAVYLDGVKESNFGFGAVAEWLQQSRVGLQSET